MPVSGVAVMGGGNGPYTLPTIDRIIFTYHEYYRTVEQFPKCF